MLAKGLQPPATGIESITVCLALAPPPSGWLPGRSEMLPRQTLGLTSFSTNLRFSPTYEIAGQQAPFLQLATLGAGKLTLVVIWEMKGEISRKPDYASLIEQTGRRADGQSYWAQVGGSIFSN